MQVARKYAPTSAVVIGVDLVQIQPIRGCIALQADITTAQCRALLQREMRDWKVDVVLNDGAPSMGASWLHDAYTQSELTLHALRLACEFLMPGGVFISKLFRSKDYNAMYWVLTQLFDKVESTKPVASRDVSAEMFIVCRGFFAPKKIDPRLLDPKHVFKEVSPLAPAAKLLSTKKKQKPLREGYDDDIGQIVHKRACVTQFIDCANPGQFLGLFHEITFDPSVPLALDHNGRSIGSADAAAALDDIVPEAVRESTGKIEQIARREAQKLAAKQSQEATRSEKVANVLSREAAIAFYAAHPQTPGSMQAQLRDIRLLSRTDLKKILQWRERMRKARDMLVDDGAGDDDDDDDELDSEEKLERELDAELDRADARSRRKLRKQRRMRAKHRVREALGIATPFNDEQQQNMDVFELAEVEKLAPEVQAVLRSGRDGYADKRAALDEERHEAEAMERSIRFRLGPDLAEIDSDSGSRDGAVDDMLEVMYQDYKESKRLRAAAQRSRELRNMSTHKRLLMQQDAEAMIADEDRARRQAAADVDAELRFGTSKKRGRADGSEEYGSSEDDDSDERRKLDALAATPATARAAMWYDQALFEGLEVPTSNGGDHGNENNSNYNNDDNDNDDDDDEDNDDDARVRKSKAPPLSAMELADRRRVRISSGDSDSSVSDDDDDFGSGSADDESDDPEAALGLYSAAEKAKRENLHDLFVTKEEAAAAEASESDSLNERKVVARKSRRELEREAKRAEMLGLKSDKPDDKQSFEIVPIDESSEDTDSDKGGQDAQLEALAYARALVNGRRRRDELEDNAFNRRAFADTEGAPDWFVDNERAHNKVSLPVTREDLIAVRQQEIALNARPIKRLVEAKMRKLRRSRRRIERTKQQANAIADQTDIDDKAKMRLLEKLYRGGKAKEEKRERVYVITSKGGKTHKARGATRGRVVRVDPRMKKEKRAKKASEKRSAKRSRSQNKKRARHT
jgi:AdoMet-dependent rRNA methyltransferase SPB1